MGLVAENVGRAGGSGGQIKKLINRRTNRLI